MKYSKGIARVTTLLLSDKYLLVLVSIQLFVILYSLMSYPFSSGPISGGDLEIPYLNTRIVVNNLIGFNLYYLFQWTIFHFFGLTAAQNGVFLLVTILPAFGIYFLSLQLTNIKVVALASAISLGTILNPILLADLDGGVEYYLFLFFTYLSLTILIKAKTNKTSSSYSVFAIAGVLWGLSITSNQFFPNGIYISGLIILAILFCSAVYAGRPFLRKITSNILVFIFMGTIVMSYLIFSKIFPVLEILKSNTSSSQSMLRYAISTIIYESKGYGPLHSLLDAVYNGSYYLNSPFWYIIVLVSLAGGLLSIFYKGTYRKETILAFIVYLLASLAIILYHYGVYMILLYFHFFYSLDYPQFFVLIQQISLVILFSYSMSFFVKFITNRKSINRSHDYNSLNFLESASGKNTRSRLLYLRNKVFQNLCKFMPLIVVVIVFFGSVGQLSQVQHYYPPESSIAGVSYQESGKWFISSHINTSEKLLILPNTYNTLLKINGYIPSSNIWNPPQPLPAPGGYNISYVSTVLHLMANGSFVVAASMLLKSDVVYVLVIVSSFSQNVTLVPNGQEYGISNSLLISLPILIREMNNSKDFILSYSTDSLYIYRIT